MRILQKNKSWNKDYTGLVNQSTNRKALKINQTMASNEKMEVQV